MAQTFAVYHSADEVDRPLRPYLMLAAKRKRQALNSDCWGLRPAASTLNAGRKAEAAITQQRMKWSRAEHMPRILGEFFVLQRAAGCYPPLCQHDDIFIKEEGLILLLLPVALSACAKTLRLNSKTAACYKAAMSTPPHLRTVLAGGP